uniref:A20-type domain-containing protein n=1 Tax=Oryza rufipogon TaxID=4529 RepID=A0A0E0QJG5_ORYRU
MAAKQLELDAGGGGGGGGVPSCANCCGGVVATTTARSKNLCARCYRDHLNAVDGTAEAARTRALLASLACDLNVGTFGDAHGGASGFGFKNADRDSARGGHHQVVEVGDDGEGAAVTRLRRRRMVRTCE